MNYIVDGTNRMSRLIQGLLAYSQIEAITTTRSETADTDEALSEALQNLALTIKETSAILTHDPLPRVNGNQEQLAQLFLNLIGNALKYRRVTPRIHVSAQRAGAGWSFRIRDNGPGIPAEQRERIFEVFVRLHGREVSGVGLGLTFCAKIVELHQGRIWVEENTDASGGSVFCFTIPC